jgi:hypothetical protein
MPTTLRPHRVVSSAPEKPGIRGLCLLVALVAACSVDVARLQAPKSPVADGAMAYSVSVDTMAGDLGDAENRKDDSAGDRASGTSDLPGVDKDAARDGAREPGPDTADDVVLADDVIDDPDLSDRDGETDDTLVDDGDGQLGTGGTGGAGDGGGGTGGVPVDSGGSGGIGVDPDLVLWYKFDESSGPTAADSSPSGGVSRDGTLATSGTSGSADFSTDSLVGTHALSLTPSTHAPSYGGGYVTMPVLQTLAPDALTIAVWVKLATATPAQDWARVFDCGSGTVSSGGYFYMTARAADVPIVTPVRFGISKSAHKTTGEQRLESSTTLTANVWHHLVVVLPAGSPYTGTLYIDGAVAAVNSAMSLHLSDIAVLTNNWLGRSAFSDDPFFSGLLDDFRIYRRALSQEEISALFALR